MDTAAELRNVKCYNGKNFHLLKFQIRAILLGQDLMGVVDGSVPKPVVVVQQADWVKKDNQVTSLLCKALDESILESLMTCTTSKQIWDKLQLLHDQQAHESVHHIQQRFFECKMETGDSIATFLGKLEVIKSQLLNMGDNSITDPGLMAKVIANLPPKFTSFVTAWDNVEDASRTLQNFTIHLLRHESQLKSEEEASIVAVAYIAAAKSTNTGSSFSSSDGRPSLTYEERQARRREIDERKKKTSCWKCGQVGHWARECTEMLLEAPAKKQEHSSSYGAPKPTTPRAYMASSTTIDSDSWYVDSGCTEHMTNSHHFFTSFTDISYERKQ
jgi:hypothetical protein